MFELYFTDGDVHEKLNALLSRYLTMPFEIATTKNGKPYIEGNPLFFSISHSREKSAVAVCDSEIGLDIEFLREREYFAVLSRFCAEERAEIKNFTDFLKHWVVREAYVKMLGATLAEKLSHIKYINGQLYDSGEKVSCDVFCGLYENCAVGVCVDKKRQV